MTTTNKDNGLPRFGRAAEVRSESFNETDNTIEVVWTTGAGVRRWDWRRERYYNEVLEVSSSAIRLGRLNAGAPLLDSHNDYSLRSVLGSVVPGSAKVEGGVGVARVKLSRADADAAIVEKIRDGVIRNISVGYAIHKVVKTEANGDGADDEWRVVDWEPMEISAVPIPADAGSQIRNDNGEVLLPCEFINTTTEAVLADTETIVEPSADVDTTPTTEARVSEAAIEVRAAAPVVAPAVATPAPADAVRAPDAGAGERSRVVDILRLAGEANLRALGDQYITDGKSVDEFRSAILSELLKREAPAVDNRTPATVGTEHAEKRAALMQNAIMHRANPAVALAEGANEYRGFTLIDMAREALELRGENTRGLDRHEIAARALAQRSGGYGTTSDFPVILGNVVNTTLRAGYEAAGQTFRPLVREVSVSDFKAVNRAQLGEGPAFEKVSEHGEFKRGSVGEGKESYKIATFGKIIAITRQVIVNDDMNAFSRIPQLLGGAAAQLESDLVWHQILSNPVMGDGTALFHADHKNLPTAAAFGVAALGKARALMAKQVGLDGKTVLNIRPQYLVVPVELETKAEQELRSAFYPDASEKVATASMKQLQIIAEPRLDNGINNKAVGAPVAGSLTAWYLSASPGAIDTVELAYLEGNRGVYTETRYGFDIDGVEIKGRLDVGAKTIDHRGLLKNAGA